VLIKLGPRRGPFSHNSYRVSSGKKLFCSLTRAVSSYHSCWPAPTNIRLLSPHPCILISFLSTCPAILSSTLWMEETRFFENLMSAYNVIRLYNAEHYRLDGNSYFIRSINIVSNETIIEFLDIIHGPVFYLKSAFRRINSCLRPHVNSLLSCAQSLVLLPISRNMSFYNVCFNSVDGLCYACFIYPVLFGADVRR
jgi:hypothetical protein